MNGGRRALRRFHRTRMVNRAPWIARLYAMNEEDARRWALRNADHLKNCSCWMCGHRRRTLGPTIQERRLAFDF